MAITTGLTTKTWSDSLQESSLKGDSKHTSGIGQSGIPEGKDVGTFLNEIADPNWVDPSKMRKTGNSELDKDAFFQLMLAQIKNQDPMNPMKSDEMAAQLAQFTSLEQLMNVNEKLDGLTKAQQPLGDYQAVNFIGKSISADTAKIVRSPGDKTHDLKFQLPRAAKKATLIVKNQNGETVKTYELPDLKSGENKLTWNGLDQNSNPTRAGEYYFEVTAEGGRGEKIAVQTSFQGRVSGVNYTPQGPVLMIGNQTVRLQDVQKIEDPSLKSDQSSNSQKPSNLALPKGAAQNDNENVPGAGRAATGNLDSIAMAQAVLDETNKAQAALAKEGMKK